MEILGWLAFPVLVTLVAMAWAGWAGRGQRQSERAEDAAYDRLVAALTKDTPALRKRVPPAPVMPSTGVARRRPGSAVGPDQPSPDQPSGDQPRDEQPRDDHARR